MSSTFSCRLRGVSATIHSTHHTRASSAKYQQPLKPHCRGSALTIARRSTQSALPVTTLINLNFFMAPSSLATLSHVQTDPGQTLISVLQTYSKNQMWARNRSKHMSITTSSTTWHDYFQERTLKSRWIQPAMILCSHSANHHLSM